MKRALKQIFVDVPAPSFGHGIGISQERLEQYYESIAGPKGRAKRLLGRLSTGGYEREYPVVDDEKYRGATYGSVLFMTRKMLKHNLETIHVPEDTDKTPIVVAQKFVQQDGDRLTVMADRSGEIRSVRLDYGDQAGMWVEAQFSSQGDIYVRDSSAPDFLSRPSDEDGRILNNIADAVTVAERRPFVDLS